MIRVALADDADEMRFLVRVVLETDGRFEVVGDAADGVEAMALIERESPDALILDMAMPNMDGLEVLAELKARGLHPKIVAFSGFNGGVEQAATELGADSYLRKGAQTIKQLVPTLISLFA